MLKARDWNAAVTISAGVALGSVATATAGAAYLASTGPGAFDAKDWLQFAGAIISGIIGGGMTLYAGALAWWAGQQQIAHIERQTAATASTALMQPAIDLENEIKTLAKGRIFVLQATNVLEAYRQRSSLTPLEAFIAPVSEANNKMSELKVELHGYSLKYPKSDPCYETRMECVQVTLTLNLLLFDLFNYLQSTTIAHFYGPEMTEPEIEPQSIWFERWKAADIAHEARVSQQLERLWTGIRRFETFAISEH